MILEANAYTACDRVYAYEQTRKTYEKLMATPKATRIIAYAWREEGEKKASFTSFGHIPSAEIYGSAEGLSLRAPNFAYINGWRASDFLTFEEEQRARRATEEIHLRNACEMRRLKALATADLLRKEAAINGKN